MKIMSSTNLVNDVTIVTCLLDINRGEWSNIYSRRIQLYFTYLYEVLKLDNYFYIYIDDKYKETLYDILSMKTDEEYKKVKVIPIKIEDLIMYARKDKITSIMNDSEYKKDLKDPVCPEVSVPEYNIVVNSKVDLVYKASLENPFNTEFFLWLDAGYGHGKLSLQGKWTPRNILENKDKVNIICLEHPDNFPAEFEEFFRQHVDVVIGGAFGGGKEVLEKYHKEYYSVLDEALENKITDDDQYTVVMSYKRYPHLFKVYLTSDWYSAFSIL